MTERDIFVAAFQRTDSAERGRYLEEACGGDAELRRRVENLLGLSEGAGSFLEVPAVGVLDQAETPGMHDTRTSPMAADGGDGLDFLEPSDKPASLGRLGHYEVLEVVGRGGMGIVLRAFDETLHRVVAVKVMAAQLATSANARKRFTREARAAAAVTHDHILTIHAVEDAGPLPYIVMQFVAGASLQDRLDREGPLQLTEILRIGMQTACGLAAAHAQGLVHRDVKPANILLENGVERVKLTDFGLARAADDASLTQSGVVAGTPSFMSPEQAEGRPVDHRSDLFSLGSVLYAMCTGRPPFRAGTTMGMLRRVCEETPSPIRETNPEIPKWLATVVEKLHAKDPAARYQSAEEVAELLGQHLAHVQHPSVVPLPAVVKSAGGPAAPARPERRKRWAVAAAILVAVIAALGTAEATGVTNVRVTVIRVFTPEGTLVVETDDPGVKVTVEGDGDLVITGAKPQEVRLRAGSYRLHAVKDGKPVRLDQQLVTITRGGRCVVSVTHEPLAATPIDHAREANAQVAKGRLDEAAKEFSTALDLTAVSGGNDAVRRRIVEQIVTSDEIFPRVVKLRPKVLGLWNHRANHLAEQGRWDEAEVCIRTRLELGPDGAGLWENYAVVCLKAHNQDTYRQVCETMLTTYEEIDHPHEAWRASWAMALAPHSVKNNQKALRLAERAMKGLPNTYFGARPYAAWLYRLDRLAESVACWDKAGKEDDEEIRICFLAMAHHRLGNPDLADRFVKQARAKKADWAKLTGSYRRACCELLLNEMEKVVSGKPD